LSEGGAVLRDMGFIFAERPYIQSIEPYLDSKEIWLYTHTHTHTRKTLYSINRAISLLSQKGPSRLKRAFTCTQKSLHSFRRALHLLKQDTEGFGFGFAECWALLSLCMLPWLTIGLCCGCVNIGLYWVYLGSLEWFYVSLHEYRTLLWLCEAFSIEYRALLSLFWALWSDCTFLLREYRTLLSESRFPSNEYGLLWVHVGLLSANVGLFWASASFFWV